MNLSDYTYILNKPDAINDRQTAALEKIVDEFPFFQSARALRLKGLYNEDSFKYNYALKVTAAHTTDRSVLFDFITSQSFTTIQKGLYDQKLEALHDIMVTDIEIVAPHVVKATEDNTVEHWILNSIKKANAEPEPVAKPHEDEPKSASPQVPHELPADIESIETENPTDDADIEKKSTAAKSELEIGKPLDFSRNETHSFREWLQLSALNPIEREPEPELSEPKPESTIELAESEKQKKNEIINRFIEANPKIPPVRDQVPIHTPVVETSSTDQNYLMTETLARVYLEQKKYSKAIQAYQILILKYPEKSSFFADRILDIKHLQQNNNNK